MSKLCNITLISPLGIRDPWFDWKKEDLKRPEYYGPALTVLEEHSDKIEKVIFLTSQKTKEAQELIQNQIDSFFPKVDVEWVHTGLENVSDLIEIEDKWFPLLKEIKDKQKPDSIYWINLAPGSPQIIQYLATLTQLSFWGTPYKKAFMISVKNPKYVPIPPRVEIQEEPKANPIKELIDASHLTTLINRYDYNAVLNLLDSNSRFSTMELPIRFLKECIDIYFQGIVFNEAERDKLPENFKYFIQSKLFNCFENDQEQIKEWLYYSSIKVKFKREEWQDAVIRLAVLREHLLISWLKSLPEVKDCLISSDRGGSLFFPKNKLTEKELDKLRQIGNEIYKGKFNETSFFSKDNNLCELTASNSQLLLMLFATNPEREKKLEVFMNKKIPNLGNRFVHNITQLKRQELNKMESFLEVLEHFFQFIHPDAPKTYNFFDAANKVLLEEYDLAWMLPNNKV